MALYNVLIGGHEYRVDISHGQATVDGQPVDAGIISLNKEGLHLLQRGRQALEFFLHAQDAENYQVLVAGRRLVTRVISGSHRLGSRAAEAQPGKVAAPMHGLVVNVLVAEGDAVEKDQTLVVLESMKMQMQIRAPQPGTVRKLACQKGQQVEKGALLVELAE